MHEFPLSQQWNKKKNKYRQFFLFFFLVIQSFFNQNKKFVEQKRQGTAGLVNLYVFLSHSVKWYLCDDKLWAVWGRGKALDIIPGSGLYWSDYEADLTVTEYMKLIDIAHNVCIPSKFDEIFKIIEVGIVC